LPFPPTHLSLLYTLSLHDALPISTSDSVTVPNIAGPSSYISSQTSVSCNGGNDGSATVIATGGIAPYYYNWIPPGSTTATATGLDRKSTRLNSSHLGISYAVFCLK